jgi:hypothetical protein
MRMASGQPLRLGWMIAALLRERPDVAFVAALHVLTLKTFYRYGSDSHAVTHTICVAISVADSTPTSPRLSDGRI